MKYIILLFLSLVLFSCGSRNAKFRAKRLTVVSQTYTISVITEVIVVDSSYRAGDTMFNQYDNNTYILLERVR